VALLRRQIREIEVEAAALNDQLAAEARAIGLQREELKANEDLLKQNYVQKTRVLTLQRAVGRIRGAPRRAPRRAGEGAPESSSSTCASSPRRTPTSRPRSTR
jgi:hypothetical protein